MFDSGLPSGAILAISGCSTSADHKALQLIEAVEQWVHNLLVAGAHIIVCNRLFSGPLAAQLFYKFLAEKSAALNS